MFLVNKQDFLQVFQGSGIGKLEDSLTSADPLSYTTTIMMLGRPGKLSERLLTRRNFQFLVHFHGFLFFLCVKIRQVRMKYLMEIRLDRISLELYCHFFIFLP